MVADIIKQLEDGSSLIQPLQATLILAKRLGNEDLSKWTLQELKGYDNEDTTPNYRHTRNNFLGVVKQNGQRSIEFPLPLHCFGEYFESRLSKHIFIEGIGALESILGNSANTFLVRAPGPEFCLGLTQQAVKNGCKFEVLTCREVVAISEVAGVVTSVRTKLVELLLGVEDNLPEIESPNKSSPEETSLTNSVTTYMNQTFNIHSSGSGAAISAGNDNVLHITNHLDSKGVSEKCSDIIQVLGNDNTITETIRAEVVNTFTELNKEASVGTVSESILNKALTYGADIASIGSLVVGIIQLLKVS